MIRRNQTRGQALVEFALASTVIFLLLAAAIDVGLIMFTIQGLHNAAQEGASFGSRWLITDASNRRVVDVATIKDHVRHESGDRGGNGFIDLLDLNDDGVDDSTQPAVLASNITVEMLADPSMDGDPTVNVATGAAENVACTDASTATTVLCYVRVTVRSAHKMVFPVIPTFANSVPLKSSYIMPIRDSMARGTGTGTSTQVKTCTVPSMTNMSINSAGGKWVTAGFTGTITSNGSGNYTVKTQSLSAGIVTVCTDGVTLGP